MKRKAKVAVSIPVDTLNRLDRESRRLGQSRSAVVTLAVEAWIRRHEASQQDEKYVEGYLLVPEGSSEAIASAAIATWEPWP